MNSTSPRLTEDDLILSINPGHDGTMVILQNGTLIRSVSAEHDSHPRFAPSNAYFLLRNLAPVEKAPSLIALSGWSKGWPNQSARTAYFGVDDSLVRITPGTFLGRPVYWYESTHERSHVFCAYGLSPYPQGEPCYVLVWEGAIGSFYEVDSRLHIRSYGPVLQYPGYKYAFLFDLADPTSPRGRWRHDAAGKLMALSGLGSDRTPDEQDRDLLNQIFSTVSPPTTEKAAFAHSRYYNCGVMNPDFCAFIKFFSDFLFDRFYTFAKRHLTQRYPLLISGGCGLNCDWNTKWRNCGLFADVFVPPIPNDSGSALGTAVEAQFKCLGTAKVTWSVYSGEPFVFDGGDADFSWQLLDYRRVAEMLAQGLIVAWVHGNAEMGPRALGNRSLLAAPFSQELRDRLNRIKQREWYRPIAPVCLEEDVAQLFEGPAVSHHMLYFHRVLGNRLSAVTHVDGTARVQTVSTLSNRHLYNLLKAFKSLTGIGVLCNTSLNRKGCGFFTRSSDLFDFVSGVGIDAVAIEDRLYLPRHKALSSGTDASSCKPLSEAHG